MAGFFNTTQSATTPASESFFNANQSATGASNVQDALDILFDRVNMFPIVQGDWTLSQTISTQTALPLSGDGEDGDYWFAADYPAVWPPSFWQKVDGSWVQLFTPNDYRYITTTPTSDTFPYPTVALYTDDDGATYDVYIGSFTYQPTNNNVLQYDTTTHKWEEVTLNQAMSNAGLQAVYSAVVTSYNTNSGVLVVDVNGTSHSSVVGLGLDYQSGDVLSVITLNGGFVPLSNNSANVGADISDSILKPGTTNNDYYWQQHIAFDKTNQTGRGYNIVYTTYWDGDNDELIVLSIDAITGAVSEVATIASPGGLGTPFIYLVGSTVVVWFPAGGTGFLSQLYVVLSDDSTSYVGDYSNASVMEVSGVEYLVVSDSASGAWEYYNEDGSVSGGGTLPASADAVICNKGWMWTNKGDVAAASLTPTFTSYHNVTLSMKGGAQHRLFAITPTNGHLWRVTQSGSPLVYNLVEYSSTVNNSTTNHNHIFSATDEPFGLSIEGANGILALYAPWHERVAGGVSDANGAAVWTYDGTTLTEIASTPEANAASYPLIGAAPLEGRVAILEGEGDGSLDIGDINHLVIRQVSY